MRVRTSNAAGKDMHVKCDKCGLECTYSICRHESFANIIRDDFEFGSTDTCWRCNGIKRPWMDAPAPNGLSFWNKHIGAWEKVEDDPADAWKNGAAP